MRGTTLIMLAGLLAGSPLQAQPVVVDTMNPKVTMSEMVDDNIQFFNTIANRAKLEIPFCIGGKTDLVRKTADLADLRPVAIDSASDGKIYFHSDKCGEDGAIGLLHFHTGLNFCGLSADDINFAHDAGYPIMAIVCRKKADDPLRLVVVLKETYEAKWDSLKAGSIVSKDTTTYPVTYRVVRRRPR